MIHPKVYEMLPSLYVAAGFVTELALDDRGHIPALLLVMAGVIVFNLRINARTK